ncbi:unnamed protein product, partial [Meganyctiphanes norvegica]
GTYWTGNWMANLDVAYSASVTALVFTFDIPLTAFKCDNDAYEVTGSGTTFTWTPRDYRVTAIASSLPTPYPETLQMKLEFAGDTKPALVALTVDGATVC